MTINRAQQLSDDKLIWLEEWKLAIENAQRESEWFWNRFNILLGFNLALIATTTYFFSIHHNDVTWDECSLLIVYFLESFGLLVCIMWFFLMARFHAWHGYWLSYAKKIEQKKLSGLIYLISDTKNYFQRRKFYEKFSSDVIGMLFPLFFSCIWIVFIALTFLLNSM